MDPADLHLLLSFNQHVGSLTLCNEKCRVSLSRFSCRVNKELYLKLSKHTLLDNRG